MIELLISFIGHIEQRDQNESIRFLSSFATSLNRSYSTR